MSLGHISATLTKIVDLIFLSKVTDEGQS